MRKAVPSSPACAAVSSKSVGAMLFGQYIGTGAEKTFA